MINRPERLWVLDNHNPSIIQTSRSDYALLHIAEWLNMAFGVCVTECLYTYATHPGQGTSGPRASIHPHLVSERELAVLMSKAHLIIRSIQLKIGHDLLMQVISC